jgi:hypothetical protein
MKDKVFVKRFTAPPAVFADPRDNPDNQGFCTGECLKAGVIDLQSCKAGERLFLRKILY